MSSDLVSREPTADRLRSAVPGPRSAELDRRRHAAVSSGVGVLLPAYADRGEDGLLVDVDGNRLIDLASGVAVTTVGNRNPRVVARVRAQLDRFTHTGFFLTPYESYVEVAEELNRLTPGTHEKRTALFNSGAEAVENAVKIARVATGRRGVIAFDHAFHGRTSLTMALTAKNQPYKAGFGPFAGEVHRAPMAYPYRWPSGPDRAAEEAFAAFRTIAEKQVGVENTAAVILEPVQGEGGFVVPAPGFFRRVAQWCADHGAVFIADEVQTGMCRTGDWFASAYEQTVPDLVTTAKGLAGGLPLSGVTGRAELMDSVGPGGLGGTYGGNPLACEAALGAIEAMEEGELCVRAREIEAVFRTRLGEIADRHASVGEVRGRGAMMALELVEDPETRKPAAGLTRRIQQYCLDAGVLVLTAGTFDNVLRFLPPLVIGDDQLERGLTVLGEAFDALA
ncbi:4-aminobutyrate--2-oxoglutarate transaminase [Streptomyces sp. NPDC004542]|uniref:4-aminobutyrate--2-oxoglutarate transaminase n=1 Tax=Streptomyces sp. NPDC004542 TaxID=3154281 RepID=UPI0033A8FA21